MNSDIFSNDDYEIDTEDNETADDSDVWSLEEDSDFEIPGYYSEEIDSDMDGVADTFIEELDLDGDGVSDVVSASYDTDGDGIIDTIRDAADINFDGYIDVVHTSQDLNNDGIMDVSSSEVDLDFDGDSDFSVFREDTNFDGENDNTEVAVATGDGSGDAFFMRATDLDFDGKTDDVDFSVEENAFQNTGEDSQYNEDGDLNNGGNDYDFINDEPVDVDPVVDPVDADPVVDPVDVDPVDVDPISDDPEVIIEDDDSLSPYIDLEELGYDDSNDNGSYSYDLGNFDPSSADPDSVIGDPEEAMGLWEYQGNTNRCAVYSQKFVIEEYTGEEVDIEELVDIASENGWFTETGGTTLGDMDALLEHYNVPHEATFGNDFNDIVESLNEGHKVIVAVDAEEYWYGENDNIYTPGDGPNHAAEVIGIDNSDPENPVVILNDSGNPNGCGCEIPVETFMDAWEDGNCYMIECL